MTRAPMYAAVADVLLGFAEELGLSRRQGLEAAGLQPEDLARPEAPIPFEAPIRVWQYMLAHRPDQPLGLMLAEKMRPDAFGLAGHLFRHSESLEQVVERMTQYQALVDPALDLRIVANGDQLRVEFHHDPRVLELAHPLEGMIGAGVHTLREWVASPLAVQVWFAHPPLHSREVYARYLDVPVLFEQPANAIVVPTAAMSAPIDQADPAVAQFLKRLADERLVDQGDDSLTQRVAAAIEVRLRDPALSQDDVATDLGMSVRTMQRRLREEGHNYTQILDRVRREVAERLLRAGSHAVYEVADELGYAEPASFTRAFRRWTGQAPRDFAVAHDQ